MAGSSYGRYVAAALPALIRTRPKASAQDIAKSAHDIAEAVLTEGRRRHVERMAKQPKRVEAVALCQTHVPSICPLNCPGRTYDIPSENEARGPEIFTNSEAKKGVMTEQEWEEAHEWPKEQP